MVFDEPGSWFPALVEQRLLLSKWSSDPGEFELILRVVADFSQDHLTQIHRSGRLRTLSARSAAVVPRRQIDAGADRYRDGAIWLHRWSRRSVSVSKRSVTQPEQPEMLPGGKQLSGVFLRTEVCLSVTGLPAVA